MIMHKTALVSMLICTHALRALPATYLVSIVNNTYDTLYEAIFAEESYKILVPAGTTKNLEHWINLERGSTLIVAPLKGDGKPIFVLYGPESAGECASVPQSVQTWTGQPLPQPSEKTYTTYCLDKDEAELSLHIDENGQPNIEPVSGAQELSVV